LQEKQDLKRKSERQGGRGKSEPLCSKVKDQQPHNKTDREKEKAGKKECHLTKRVKKKTARREKNHVKAPEVK